MPKFLKIFFTGLLISALGTLPLGTLNIISMQLSVAEGYMQAFYFALGVVLVEIMYVRISLVGMHWVRQHQSLFRWLEWMALLIVIALAIGSFLAASKPTVSQNLVLENNMHRFIFGLFLSAINPVQIPFWFGWSTILITKKILTHHPKDYNYYTAGIGLGSLIGLCLFIFGGVLFATYLSNHSRFVHYAVGGVFSVTAVIQILKLLNYKKKAKFAP